MRVDLFDFDLPEAAIALRPCEPREAARLLRVDPGGCTDHRVADLPTLLRPGDCLVFNDTRVLPAQLFGMRGAARIGITLHLRQGDRHWRAFLRNGKRVKDGDCITVTDEVVLRATDRRVDGSWLVEFLGTEPVEALLARAGQMPLPPYIARRRPADARDQRDYQTHFAARDGAVAAPTAGLHFTPALLKALTASGIATQILTLHVGAGTFLPVKVDDSVDHVMHAEWGEIAATTAHRLNAIRAHGGRVIPVGTTCLRLIESATGPDGIIRAFSGETAIFITPGYRFRGVDGLFTNFHLPRSTLFMLVSALMGLDTMQAAYAHAIHNGYRFYSYGDASLLLPTG